MDEKKTYWIRIENLVPCAEGANPNSMSEEQYVLLREAIRRKGFVQPILVSVRSDGRYDIVDGHHRVRAASELGMETVQCVIRSYTADEINAIRLGMNRTRGEIDLSVAKSLITDLHHNGWSEEELTLTGFSFEELNELLRKDDSEPVAEASGVAPEEPSTPAKPHILEIAFSTKEEYQKARKRLMKAAGKTRDLGLGLFAILGEDSG